MNSETRLRVGHVRNTFLPRSETFIYQSLVATQHVCDASVFCTRRLLTERYPLANVTTLRDAPLGRLRETRYKAGFGDPALSTWVRNQHVVHAHLGHTAGYVLPTTKRLGVPLVVSFYGADVGLPESAERKDPSYWPYLLRRRALFAHPQARLVVLSAHMRDEMVKQGAPAARLRIVRLGIDTERFRPGQQATSTLRVLMVGREVEKKGFDDALVACQLATRQGHRLEIALLGTGTAGAAPLRRLANELGLTVNWLNPELRTADVMRDYDVLLAPSRTAANGDREGTPTVICEASAAGLAIISTRHSGIPEQVDDGVTGLLTNERDPHALAAHLATLAQNPSAALQMGAAGRRKMLNEYSQEVHAVALAAVYRELYKESL